MSKSNNIIEFYMYANALKHKIRTGNGNSFNEFDSASDFWINYDNLNIRMMKYLKY